MKKQLTLLAVAPLLVVACAKNQPAIQSNQTKSCINVSGEWTGARGDVDVRVAIAQTGCESISVTTVETDPSNEAEESTRDVVLAQEGTSVVSQDELFVTRPVFSESEIRLVTTWSHLDAEQAKDKQSIRVFKLKDIQTLEISDGASDGTPEGDQIESTLTLTRKSQ